MECYPQILSLSARQAKPSFLRWIYVRLQNSLKAWSVVTAVWSLRWSDCLPPPPPTSVLRSPPPGFTCIRPAPHSGHVFHLRLSTVCQPPCNLLPVIQDAGQPAALLVMPSASMTQYQMKRTRLCASPLESNLKRPFDIDALFFAPLTFSRQWCLLHFLGTWKNSKWDGVSSTFSRNFKHLYTMMPPRLFIQTSHTHCTEASTPFPVQESLILFERLFISSDLHVDCEAAISLVLTNLEEIFYWQRFLWKLYSIHWLHYFSHSTACSDNMHARNNSTVTHR